MRLSRAAVPSIAPSSSSVSVSSTRTSVLTTSRAISSNPSGASA
ncbi:hypothetical protein SCE1572_21035 [Sorangium cellulosum So0157-2]|uniref:Uncharacterized protein n=1 Tax=Sorangium cellulosum So0157-2 TaxID=1254432 RepID=S4XU61_SORCE|nr:hypothetical protein SCE1572_21035 [Sorangium cellulosum So0157-2]